MNKAGVGHDQTYIQFLEKKQCENDRNDSYTLNKKVSLVCDTYTSVASKNLPITQSRIIKIKIIHPVQAKMPTISKSVRQY